LLDLDDSLKSRATADRPKSRTFAYNKHSKNVFYVSQVLLNHKYTRTSISVTFGRNHLQKELFFYLF